MSASVVVIWLMLMNYDINHHVRYDYILVFSGAKETHVVKSHSNYFSLNDSAK